MTWDKFYTPQNIDIIQAKCRLGWSNEDLAAYIGISTSTLYEWQKKHSEFSEALKEGKDYCVAQVEGALFEKSKGINKTFMETNTETFEVYDPDGKLIGKKIRTINREKVIYVPPDTKAAMFYLTNIAPDDWKQKQQTELSGSISVDADINLEERLIKARSVGNESGNSITADGHIGITDA